jgi:hypothetical protein
VLPVCVRVLTQPLVTQTSTALVTCLACRCGFLGMLHMVCQDHLALGAWCVRTTSVNAVREEHLQLHVCSDLINGFLLRHAFDLSIKSYA